jgi:hypothetical protein
MTTQEIVNQAANTHASGLSLGANASAAQKSVIRDLAAEDFKAGAEWALSRPELMREVSVDFAKWRDDYIRSKGRIARSDDELFALYLEHLNLNP